MDIFDDILKAAGLAKDDDVSPLLERMRGGVFSQESGGNYQVKPNKRTGATGGFQVLPENIPTWTQKHLGKRLTREQFERDPDAQEKVFAGEMGEYLRDAKKKAPDDDTAIRMAAAGWYGGKGAMHRYDDPNRFRPNEPSFREYTTSVLKKSQPDLISDILSQSEKLLPLGGNDYNEGVRRPQDIDQQENLFDDILSASGLTSNPVPETPQTLEAQTASALDAKSPKGGVLFTNGQEKLVDPSILSPLKRVERPEGVLYVNPNKFPDFDKRTTAELIGKVDNVKDTSKGDVLVTTDAQGNELSSSIVTPESAAKQAELDKASYPQAVNQGITDVDEAVKLRNDQIRILGHPPIDTLGGPHSPVDPRYADFLKQTGLPDSPASQKEFAIAQQASDAGARAANQPVSRPARQTPVRGAGIAQKQPSKPEEITANVNWAKGSGRTAKEFALDEAASQFSSKLGIDYDTVRNYLDRKGPEGLTPEEAEKRRSSRQETSLALDANAIQEVKFLSEQNRSRKEAIERKEEEYKTQGIAPFEALLRASKDVGLTEFDGKDIDKAIADENAAEQAVMGGIPTTAKSASGLQNVTQARFGAEVPVGGAVPDDPQYKQAQLDEARKGIIASYGSFSNFQKTQERLKKEYQYRPLAEPLEFAKSFGSTVPKAVASVLKTIDIAANLNPIKLGADAALGRGIKVDETVLSQIGDGINKYIEDSKNKDVSTWYTTTLPDTIGQVLVQIGVGALSGGATAPTLLGASMGAASQYDEAKTKGATDGQKLVAATVGALAAVPDAILFNKWFKGAGAGEKTAFINNLTKSLYARFGVEFGDDAAKEMTKSALHQWAKNVGSGAIGEGLQEVSENKINDALAYATYDASPERLKKLTTINDEDIASFFGGVIGGGFGGAIESYQELKPALKTELIERTEEKLDKALRQKEISPEQFAQAQKQIATLKNEKTPLPEKSSPVVKTPLETDKNVASKDAEVLEEPKTEIPKSYPEGSIPRATRVRSGEVVKTETKPNETKVAVDAFKRRIGEVEKRAEAKIAEAYRDEKTGLANQNAFVQATKNLTERQKSGEDKDTHVVVLDIIGQKDANSGLGFTGSDNAVLIPYGKTVKEVAMAAGVPERDIFRAGGDEFAIHVQGEENARALAAKIQQTIGTTEHIATEKEFVNRDKSKGKAGDKFTTGVRIGVGRTFEEADAETQVAKLAEEKAKAEKGKEEKKVHQVYYNGRIVDMDYAGDAKDQFKFGAMRIADNLGTGGHTESEGYVRAPDGKLYVVSKSSRKAKLLTGDAKARAELKFIPRETITPAEDIPVGKNAAGEQLYDRKDGKGRYRMRNDRADRPNGYPDHGGDLAPVETKKSQAKAEKNDEQNGTRGDTEGGRGVKRKVAESTDKGDLSQKTTLKQGEEPIKDKPVSTDKRLSEFERNLNEHPDRNNPNVYVPGKSAWEVTKKEWVGLQPPAYKERAALGHHTGVAQAIARGRAVAPEVLADYPDLLKKAQAKGEGKEEKKTALPPKKKELPPVAKYSEYVQQAVGKFKMTADEVRDRYGKFTTEQWETLLAEPKPNLSQAISTPEQNAQVVEKAKEEKKEQSKFTPTQEKKVSSVVKQLNEIPYPKDETVRKWRETPPAALQGQVTKTAAKFRVTEPILLEGIKRHYGVDLNELLQDKTTPEEAKAKFQEGWQKAYGNRPETIKGETAKTKGSDARLLKEFETEYGLIPSGYRQKLDEILARDPDRRKSGLDLLALKEMPSSPLQKLIQNLRTSGAVEPKKSQVEQNKAKKKQEVAEKRAKVGKTFTPTQEKKIGAFVEKLQSFRQGDNEELVKTWLKSTPEDIQSQITTSSEAFKIPEPLLIEGIKRHYGIDLNDVLAGKTQTTGKNTGKESTKPESTPEVKPAKEKRLLSHPDSELERMTDSQLAYYKAKTDKLWQEAEPDSRERDHYYDERERTQKIQVQRSMDRSKALSEAVSNIKPRGNETGFAAKPQPTENKEQSHQIRVPERPMDKGRLDKVLDRKVKHPTQGVRSIRQMLDDGYFVKKFIDEGVMDTRGKADVPFRDLIFEGKDGEGMIVPKIVYDAVTFPQQGDTKVAQSKPTSFPDFVSQKMKGDWYVSNVPVKGEEAKGAKRINRSDFKKLQEEFDENTLSMTASKVSDLQAMKDLEDTPDTELVKNLDLEVKGRDIDVHTLEGMELIRRTLGVGHSFGFTVTGKDINKLKKVPELQKFITKASQGERPVITLSLTPRAIDEAIASMAKDEERGHRIFLEKSAEGSVKKMHSDEFRARVLSDPLFKNSPIARDYKGHSKAVQVFEFTTKLMTDQFEYLGIDPEQNKEQILDIVFDTFDDYEKVNGEVDFEEFRNINETTRYFFDASKARSGKETETVQDSKKPAPEKQETGSDVEGNQKVASFSRILGQDYYYDPQSHKETEAKAQQLLSDKGTQQAVWEALNGKPSAETMRVVYWELERLNGLADHYLETGDKAFNAVAEEIADLSAKIVARQVKTGQEVEIAKTLAPLSPEVAVLTAVKMKRFATGDPDAVLTDAETKQTLEIAKELKDANKKLAEINLKLRQAENKIKRLESDREPTRRTPQARMLKEYQAKKPDLIAKLKEAFPNSPMFNGKESALSMVAWHGSPHKFDKFSLDKIGTGEGAQAYGYGLYFTDKESIADYYKNALTGMKATVRYDGADVDEYVDFDKATPQEAALAMLPTIIRQGVSADYIKALQADIRDRLRDTRDRLLVSKDPERIAKLEEREANYEKALEGAEGLYTKSLFVERAGAKYKVDLKPAEDEYLLWDKPLSEQSEKVKKALEGGGLEKWLPPHTPAATGQSLYSTLGMKQGGDPAASELLKSLGIRGIKFLDGTSRGKGEGSYNYVIFDDNDVEIQETFQMAAPKELDPEQKDLLTQYAAGLILEGKSYDETIKTLEDIAGTDVREVHAKAVEMIRPSKPMSDEAKERAKIRNEHYAQAKKFLKPEMSGIAQDAQEQGLSKELIFAIDRLTGEKPKSINEVVKDIEHELKIDVHKAVDIAREANQKVRDIKAKRREEADKEKGVSAEERQKLNDAKVAKARATYKLNKFLNQLSHRPWVMERFNNDFRAKLVSNWGTQLFNAVQGTLATGTESILDLMETGLKVVGNPNPETTLDINAKDTWLPLAYVFSSNKQIGEQALSEFPEEYYKVHSGLLGDIELDTPKLAPDAHALTKPFHAWFDKMDVLNKHLSNISGAKMQEMHFRNAIVASSFDQVVRKKSGGKETLKTALANNTLTQYITAQEAKLAADKALRVTFASMIDDPVGKQLKRVYDQLDKVLPVMLNPVTFARFTYTTTKVMVANPLLMGALDAKTLGGEGYNTRSIAKGILGWSAIVLSYGLLSAFGDDDDRWETLKIGDTTFDVRRFFPMSAFFYMAHLIKSQVEGRPTPDAKELAEGFASLETDYFRYGAPVEMASVGIEKYKGTKDWSDVGAATAGTVGSYLAGFTRFFKPMKDALAQFDKDEAKFRDFSDSGKDKFIKEISKSLPFVARGIAPTIDPVTGKEIEAKAPLAKSIGINIVNPSFLNAKETPATEWANRLFQFTPQGEWTDDARKAFFIRKRLKEAVYRKEVRPEELDGRINEFVKQGKLTEKSAAILRKDLQLSEVAVKLKYGYKRSKDPETQKIMNKKLEKVLRHATEQEQVEIEQVIGKRVRGSQ